MDKESIKRRIVNLLKGEKEIQKIIIFGSFIGSDSPNDIDLAIVQSSPDNYLSLALKYRKLIRSISREIPIDVFPIIENNSDTFYLKEIASGEIIYEKSN